MIRKAEKYDSKAVALLHKEGIPSGFLSSLSEDLLGKLYGTIISEGLSFVYLNGGNAVGFVSCSMNSKALYRNIIIRNFFSILPLVLGQVFKLSFIKRSIESFLIPYKTNKVDNDVKSDLPELLSIAVSGNVQAKGLGKELLDALENELKLRNVKSYKVLAGDSLVSANKFYLKNGFILKEKLELHKGKISNIYVKEL